MKVKGKTILIIKEYSDNYRKIEFTFNGEKNESVLNQNELKLDILKYTENDLMIHNIPFSIYNPKVMKILAKSINVQEAFGCDWNGFLSQFKFQDIQDNLIDVDTFKYNNFDYTNFQLSGFYGEIDTILNSKKMLLGQTLDFQQYVADFNKFYDFLKIQKFPIPNVLSKKEFQIDRFKPELFSKFTFSLNGYEGFVLCNSLATDDINLDELDVFSSNTEVILPFNLFKYLLKYKDISELLGKEIYISPKQYLNFEDNLSPLEKVIKIAELTERSDPLTRMYARYYYLIFVLKYINMDMTFIDLKSKIIQLHESNTYKTNLFYKVKK